MNSDITANIASIPSRERMLEKCVQSLLPQVDAINVFLNDYDRVPDFLHTTKVLNVFLSNNYYGDAGKFYMAEHIEGYYLSCDDDIIYPPDYVYKITSAIDKYKCLVSFHGRCYDPPIRSYYKSKKAFYHCKHEVTEDVEVDVIGSGVAGFHTSVLSPPMSIFENRNMADVYISAYAKDKGIKRVCLSHPANWIKSQSFSGIYMTNDALQTSEFNRLFS